MAATITKIERVTYRSKGDPKIATPYKPSDFDSKIHKPLIKRDFEDDTLFFEMKAAAHEVAASGYRKKIATLEELGDAETRKAAARLASLHAQMKKVQEANPDLDIDTILATFGS